MVNMTKRKLPIRLGVEQSIAGKKDVNRLSCVCPELGEFATLFITLSITEVGDFETLTYPPTGNNNSERNNRTGTRPPILVILCYRAFLN